jgi:hypothetical protein
MPRIEWSNEEFYSVSRIDCTIRSAVLTFANPASASIGGLAPVRTASMKAEISATIGSASSTVRGSMLTSSCHLRLGEVAPVHGSVRGPRASGSRWRGASDDRARLGTVVDLDVGVLAGDAGDALGLEGEAAARDVGDADLPVGRLPGEAGVADVLVLGDDGDARGWISSGSCPPMSMRTTSRSWIIMSMTTPTSTERKVMGLTRWTSMKRGMMGSPSGTAFCMARMTGLKRSMWPTMRTRAGGFGEVLERVAVRRRPRGAFR